MDEYRKLVVKAIKSVGGQPCVTNVCTQHEFAAFGLTREQIESIEEEFNILHRNIGCLVCISIHGWNVLVGEATSIDT